MSLFVLWINVDIQTESSLLIQLVMRMLLKATDSAFGKLFSSSAENACMPYITFYIASSSLSFHLFAIFLPVWTLDSGKQGTLTITVNESLAISSVVVKVTNTNQLPV